MNLYIVLGVQREATAADIRRAYRRLARQFHPGHQSGRPRRPRRGSGRSEAYETLMDPMRAGATTRPASRRTVVEATPSGSPGSTSRRAATAHGVDVRRPVRRRCSRAQPSGRRGRRTRRRLQVKCDSFEDAVRGAERPVAVTRHERCAPCDGAGCARGRSRCLSVTGTARCARRAGTWCSRAPARAAGDAAGCGSAPARPARGEGVGCAAEMVSVPDAGRDRRRRPRPRCRQRSRRRRGGAAGDLRVAVAGAAAPALSPRRRRSPSRRAGGDSRSGVGGAHRAAAPDGPVRLRIPPGTQSGQRFRLRGRGLPSWARAEGRSGRRSAAVLPRSSTSGRRRCCVSSATRISENVRGELFGRRPSDGSAQAER